MSMQEKIERVERALEQDRPHASIEAILEQHEGSKLAEEINRWLENYGEDFREHLEDYLDRFTLANKCPACLTGDTVEWGIVHGQAKCIDCGYPATIYHYAHHISPDINRDEETRRFSIPLWVHPEAINLEAMKKAD